VRNAALQAQLEGEHAAREDVARDLATAAAQVRGQVSVSIGGGRVAPFYLPCTYPSTYHGHVPCAYNVLPMYTMSMFHVLTYHHRRSRRWRVAWSCSAQWRRRRRGASSSVEGCRRATLVPTTTITSLHPMPMCIGGARGL